MSSWVAMGYVKGAFGVRGWVKTAVDTEYVDSLLDYPVWRLRKDGDVRNFEVEAGEVAGDALHIKFAGISDRDAAQLLRGYTIEINRSAFAPTDNDEYYWTDLVGLSVNNRNGEVLGNVVSLLETGAHDVLVVEGVYGQKLIPFVGRHIDSVSIADRVLVVDWGIDY